MANITLIKDKATGAKMYPVGKFLTYQHVFYNASDRAFNALCDAEESGTMEELERAEAWRNRVEDLLDKFDSNPQDSNGIVYALYQDYKDMKDIIGAYAHRHNGYV